MSYRRTAGRCSSRSCTTSCATARSLALALAMPVMMLLLYGYALSLDVDHIPTLVYDQDGTSASRDLIQQFPGLALFRRARIRAAATAPSSAPSTAAAS